MATSRNTSVLHAKMAVLCKTATIRQYSYFCEANVKLKISSAEDNKLLAAIATPKSVNGVRKPSEEHDLQLIVLS